MHENNTYLPHVPLERFALTTLKKWTKLDMSNLGCFIALGERGKFFKFE